MSANQQKHLPILITHKHYRNKKHQYSINDAINSALYYAPYTKITLYTNIPHQFEHYSNDITIINKQAPLNHDYYNTFHKAKDICNQIADFSMHHMFEEFLWMADDMIFLKETPAELFDYPEPVGTIREYCRKLDKGRKYKSNFSTLLSNTIELLSLTDYETCYCAHRPVKYDSALFWKMHNLYEKPYQHETAYFLQYPPKSSEKINYDDYLGCLI